MIFPQSALLSAHNRSAAKGRTPLVHRAESPIRTHISSAKGRQPTFSS